MSSDTNKTTEMTEDELDTTAPNSKPDVWKMPEPVFRRTSGKLPKGFVDKPEDPPTESSGDDVQAHSSPEVMPMEIAAPDIKPGNPTLKIVLVLLAVGAMIAFIVVLLSVVYFFFLR